MNDLAFDVALTELSLAILAKLIQNASCVSSLSVEAPITQALWLIHRPISFACLVIAIKVLLAVAGVLEQTVRLHMSELSICSEIVYSWASLANGA